MKIDNTMNQIHLERHIKQLQISVVETLQDAGINDNRDLELAYEYLTRLLEKVRKAKR
ncbi:hypothetical protein LPN04_10400 [Rugamonas sp. A1-17]|nr:hypothetical protein [Rugamonas sp. A1-17]